MYVLQLWAELVLCDIPRCLLKDEMQKKIIGSMNAVQKATKPNDLEEYVRTKVVDHYETQDGANQ